LTCRSLPLSTNANTATVSLGAALILTALNQFVLEPKSTEIMSERHELENADQASTDRYKKLKSSFGKLHGMSSLANLFALCAAVVHGSVLSSLLVMGA
jgi:hypothetical protein